MPLTRRCVCAAVLVAMILLTPCARAGAQPLIRIYYMPFDVLTYAPVQRQDIERASPYRIVIGHPRTPRESDHPLVAKLPTTLEAHPTTEKLQENHIRLKVEAAGKTYYVDRFGTVLETTSGHGYQLSKDEMERINDDITGLRGVVDVDVCTGPSCQVR